MSSAAISVAIRPKSSLRSENDAMGSSAWVSNPSETISRAGANAAIRSQASASGPA